jgi:DNA-binding LacI/PurR family transcriptional regulator
MSIHSVRELAKVLGLSHTTVSDALRGSPRVKAATRERVLEAAKIHGYQYNPLAGALMSQMRRSRADTFRGVIAVVDLEGLKMRSEAFERYHREVMSGAERAARKLGFKVEFFALGSEGISVDRLNSILLSRGIRGIVILPASSSPELSVLDWTHFSGVYTDYIIEHPAIDAVCSNHYRSMFMVMNKLKLLGYRRPGLVMHLDHDKRLLHRWEAAYRIYREYHHEFDILDPLILDDWAQSPFESWFTTYQPDVVLCHRTRVWRWMEGMGAKVPETHGFCCLNVKNSSSPVAGLDLQPIMIGERAIELLVSQIYSNKYGIPEMASNTTIPAAWVDGPTLRQH